MVGAIGRPLGAGQMGGRGKCHIDVAPGERPGLDQLERSRVIAGTAAIRFRLGVAEIGVAGDIANP